MEYRYSTNTINPIQETPEIDHFHEEDDDDTLSLCDLPLHHGIENDVVGVDDHDPDHGNFEFSTVKSTSPIHITDANIHFFGKSIPTRNPPQTTPSFSYNDLHRNVSTSTLPPPRRRSKSVRLPKTGKRRLPSRGGSSNGMKYNVFIGVAAKFDPPVMELGEMRKRQNRKFPSHSPMIPGSCGEEQRVVVGGNGGAHGKGRENLPRPLRFRSNFASALTKISILLAKKKPKASFGCIRQYV